MRYIIATLVLSLASAVFFLTLTSHGRATDTQEAFDEHGKASLSIGVPIPQLRELMYRDLDGNAYIFGRENYVAQALVFLSVECPMSNKLIPALNRLSRALDETGVRVLGVFSAPEDSYLSIADHVLEFDIRFPVMKDFDQQIMRALNVKSTTESLLLTRGVTVVYRGAVNEQYQIGANRGGQGRSFLHQAISRYLEKGEISRNTPSSGCIIEEEKSPPAISHEDAFSMIQEKCVRCHDGGGVAPYDFRSRSLVQQKASMIKLMLEEYRMPPWGVWGGPDIFEDGDKLSQLARAQLIDWARAGGSVGDEVPGHQVHVPRPRLEKPDLLYRIPEVIQVPAEGGPLFIYKKIPSNLREDVWVREIEFRPTSRRVLHHIFMYVVKPGSVDLESLEPFDDETFFAVYGPGLSRMKFPPGTGKRIPAGSEIVFEFHFEPGGVATVEDTTIALKTIKPSGIQEVHTAAVKSRDFIIPPNAYNLPRSEKKILVDDIWLLAVDPHAHYRARRAEFLIRPPGQLTAEKILTIPRYSTFQQRYYHLREPMKLPAGTELECRFWYDNSSRNPNNPDPEAYVWYGVRAEDEMLTCYYDFLKIDE